MAQAPSLTNPVEALAFFYGEHSPLFVDGADGTPEPTCPACMTRWPCRGQRAARTLHDAIFGE